jgi:hypothetical protein
MTSVELFNWRKKKLCQLPDLPRGNSNFNALVVNGTALICGGLISTSCYKLNKATKTWTSVCIVINFLLELFHVSNYKGLFWNLLFGFLET